MNRSTMLRAGIATLFVAVGAHVRAQQAPAANSAAAQEQAVQLSEFDVSAESTHGYVASETMTGSRVNTKIIDLPYSVVNLTSEFFDDFGVTILDENLTYLGGFTGLSIGGGFNLRGFASTSQLRDGFYRLGRYGSSNVDRIEIIRGSEAGIYGRTSPGGMVNMISKQPKKIDQQSITIREGSYGQSSGKLEMTGAIDKEQKTYYVMTLAQNARYYPGMFGEFRNNEAYAALRHDFSDSSHLQIQAEYFLNYNAGTSQASPSALAVPRTATPDNSATTSVVGYDIALGKYSPYGPDASVNRGSDTFLIEYDKEFNDVFSLRQGVQKFSARAWSYNNGGWSSPITIPASGAITDSRTSVPTFGRIMEDGGGTQTDLVAHYPALNGAIDNKTLLTMDYNDYYRWDPTFNWSSSTNPFIAAWGAAGSGRLVTLVPTTIQGKTYYVPNGPIAYFTQPLSSMWSNGPTLNSLTRRRTSQLGGNINQQMFLFDKRLILFAGLRIDNVRFSQRDYTVQFASVGFNNLPAGQGGAGQPQGSVVRRYFHQRRPNVGFNYAVNKSGSLHVYGSYSESYFVDQTNRPAAIASPGFQPQIAKGWDYGIKGSFFDEKLNFTLGGYYANQYNVSVNDSILLPNGTIQTQTLSDGNQRDKGAEIDISYLPTDNLTFQLSAGTVNAKYINFGSTSPEAVGRSVQNQTPENGSVIVKYQFSNGPLKGLDAEGLATWVSSTPSEGPTAGDSTSLVNGVVTVTGHTDQWKLRTSGYTLWTFGFHYKLPRVAENWDQTLGLNINNAFNKQYYLKASSKNYGDWQTVLFTYTLTHSGSR